MRRVLMTSLAKLRATILSLLYCRSCLDDPLKACEADPYRGVDFDDAEYGFKEEDKDPLKVFDFY